MTSRFSSLLCAAALAAASSLAGCKAKLTYVHVTVAPAPGEPAGIRKIDLQLTLAGKTADKVLGDGSKDLQLPADVTFEIGSGAGQMAITAIATDASGNEVDRGTSTVEVVSGAIGSTTVQLAGGKAALASTLTTNDFGSQQIGTTSAPATLTFRNTGAKPSGVLSVALGGVGSQHFIKGADNCNVVALPAGGSCNVSVSFRPGTLGALAATLTATGTPGGSATISLTGVGAPNPQTLTATRDGNGTGSLVFNGTNPGCTSATCSQTFAYGTTVTVTAAPAAGAHFAGWTGDCSGTGSCTVVMTQARSVKATFAVNQATVTLTISGSGTGTVTSDDGTFTCSSSQGTCSGKFNLGSTPTFTGTAANDGASGFAGWNAPGCVTTSPCTLPAITGDVALVALSRAAAPQTYLASLPLTIPLSNGTVLHDRLGGPDVTVTNGTVTIALGPRGAAVLAP